MARVQPNKHVSLPGRKPMATARRVSLFEREIRVRLSSAAVEILFELAAVLLTVALVAAVYIARRRRSDFEEPGVRPGQGGA